MYLLLYRGMALFIYGELISGLDQVDLVNLWLVWLVCVSGSLKLQQCVRFTPVF